MQKICLKCFFSFRQHWHQIKALTSSTSKASCISWFGCTTLVTLLSSCKVHVATRAEDRNQSGILDTQLKRKWEPSPIYTRNILKITLKKIKSFSTNLLGQGQSPPLMSKLGPPPPPPRPLKPVEKQLVSNFTAALIQTLQFISNLGISDSSVGWDPPPRPPLPPPMPPPRCVNSALRVANDTLIGLPWNSFPEMTR